MLNFNPILWTSCQIFGYAKVLSSLLSSKLPSNLEHAKNRVDNESKIKEFFLLPYAKATQQWPQSWS